MLARYFELSTGSMTYGNLIFAFMRSRTSRVLFNLSKGSLQGRLDRRTPMQALSFSRKHRTMLRAGFIANAMSNDASFRERQAKDIATN
jgi:hypothetical protein